MLNKISDSDSDSDSITRQNSNTMFPYYQQSIARW